MSVSKLLGKVVLITGAGDGIGAATAKAFAKHGAILSLLDVNGNGLQEVAKECMKISQQQVKPLTFVGSVADNNIRKKYVSDTVANTNRIDVLVNNAGVTKYTSILSSTLEDFDAIFDVNVRSVFHLTSLVAPHLIKTKGNIVNVASISGHRTLEGRLVYGMSKGTLQTFTKYVAQELGQHNVRVNCISPGLVRTKVSMKYGIPVEQEERYFESCGKSHILQRVGEPEEIADSIVFLASEKASFITGLDMIVDGGLTVFPTYSPTKF